MLLRGVQSQLWAMFVAVAACGHQAPAELVDAGTDADVPVGCEDADGDGAGLGASCEADDCDDTDPLTTSECGSGCAARPQRRGCPCAEGEPPVVCYHGEPEEGGIGICQPGIQACINGAFGPCEGQTLPTVERCDQRDNDCDGLIDDGVQAGCGTCGGCDSVCWGSSADCLPFGAAELDGTLELPSGALSLPRRYESRHFIWMNAGLQGEVDRPVIYKVDAVSREVVAGYHPAPAGMPRSIGVGRSGDAILSIPDDVPAVTKIAADPATCPDRNGNGRTETSARSDDVLAFVTDAEWDDECILWHQTDLGGAPRAVVPYERVIDTELAEYVWVALRRQRSFIELDSETGEPTGREVATPGVEPRIAVLAPDGRVWVLGEPGTMVAFDAADPEGTLEDYSHVPCGFYVGVDEYGYLWLDSTRGGTNLWRVDPSTEEAVAVWEADAHDAEGQKAADGEGSIWIAGFVGEPYTVYRVGVETLISEWFDLPWEHASSVGVDFHQQVWVLAHDGGPPGAIVIDAETHERVEALSDCIPGPCTWSITDGDFTGLTTAMAQGEQGLWTSEVMACSVDDEVVWTAIGGRSQQPDGSVISVWVKTAADVIALGDAAWLKVGDLPTGEGELDLEPLLRDRTSDHALAIQARLGARFRGDLPVLERLETVWGCREPLQ